jgi:hypothetical protein
MRHFLFVCLLLAAAPALAQSDINPADALAATEALKIKYGLTEKQTAEMLRIQQRKQRDWAKVTDLKNSDPSLYLAKMESLQNGTLASIRRLLTAPAQQELYQKTQTDLRNQRAEKRKEMTAQGAGKEAVKEAMLTIYAE